MILNLNTIIKKNDNNKRNDIKKIKNLIMK